MDRRTSADSLIQLLGGKENINQLASGESGTILIELKEAEKVSLVDLKKTDGVLEVLNQENQLVLRLEEDLAVQLIQQVENSKEPEQSEEDGGIGQTILGAIQGIFAPILAPLAGAGILQGIIILLMTFGVVAEGTAEEGVLSTISDAVFYFMPMLLAFSSARVFKASPFLAATVAGVLLHPDLVAAMETFNVISFFELPIRSVQYANSVIPIILVVWGQSYIERGLKKIMPDLVAPVINPLLILVLTSLLGLAVLGPIGTLIADGVAAGLNFLNGTAPWLVPTLVGTLSPFIVMFGVHYSLFPAMTLSLAELGYETILGPGMLAGNMAHAGAALAVAVRTKNQAYKSFSISATVTSAMGVSQPALYGIELILKRPLYAVLVAGGIGGLYAGIFNIRAFAFSNPSIAALPVFIDTGNNLLHAVIMSVISFAAGFMLTWVLGFEEPNDKVVAQATAGS